MADLRNEAKLLEERNSEYLKKNIALEEVSSYSLLDDLPVNYFNSFLVHPYAE